MLQRSRRLAFLWGQDVARFVKPLVGDRDGNYVAGRFLSRINAAALSGGGASRRVTPLSNASDDSGIAQFALASDEVVRGALAAAADARVPWAATRPEARGELLLKLATFLEQDADAFAKAEAINSGIAIRDSVAGVRASIAWLRFCASWCGLGGGGGSISGMIECADDSSSRSSSASSSSSSSPATTVSRGGARRGEVRTHLEPLGVVAVLSSWAGGSLARGVASIAPALAAGNVVVWKPSPVAPLTSLMLAALAHECGVPPGVLQVLQGDGAGGVGSALAASPLVNAVAFSGHARNAALVSAAAATSNLKPCFCDADDSPCIVVGCSAGDARGGASSSAVERAVDCAMNAFRFSGQNTLSYCPRRVLVPQGATCDAFLRALAARVASPRWRLGHALDAAVDQGPMASPRHQQRALDAVVTATTHAATATGQAAELVFGGFAPKFPGGHFLAPTCLFNVADTAPLWVDPVSGPVLCVSTYARPSDDDGGDSLAGAIARACATSRFGGVVHVFSDSSAEIASLAAPRCRMFDAAMLSIESPPALLRTPLDERTCHVPQQRGRISGNAVVGGVPAIVEQFCRRRSTCVWW